MIASAQKLKTYRRNGSKLITEPCSICRGVCTILHGEMMVFVNGGFLGKCCRDNRTNKMATVLSKTPPPSAMKLLAPRPGEDYSETPKSIMEGKR